MRKYANVYTAVWSDKDFQQLSKSAQCTYLLLITQPDISGAGTLPLTERRWARLSAGTTVTDIQRDLRELEAARFVYVDEDTEELLIRTFTKHDKAFTNPKRKPTIVYAADLLRSPRLRMILWAELDALGLSDSLPDRYKTLMDSLSDSLSDAHSQNHAEVDKTSTTKPGYHVGELVRVQGTHEVHEGEYPQENSLSHSISPSKWLVSTAVTKVKQPTNQKRKTNTRSSADADELPLDIEKSSAPSRPRSKRSSAKSGPDPSVVADAFARFWSAYPRKVSKMEAREIFEKLAKAGTDLEAIVAGSQAYRDDPTRNRSDAGFTAHPTTWLNKQRWLDEIVTPAAMPEENVPSYLQRAKPAGPSSLEMGTP